MPLRSQRRFFPLKGKTYRRIQMRPMTLMTSAGEVTAEIPYCQRRDEDGSWHSPLREAWGLEPNQRVSPELQERLAATSIDTPSYEAAARICAVWGSPIADDSTIARHVQKAGTRAREVQQQQERDARVPLLRERMVEKAAESFSCENSSLLIMMDGWMVRHRGDDWGLKPSEIKGERVSWREEKTAIIVRTSDCAKTASGRAVTMEKHVVVHCGQWEGLMEKVYTEALRCGLEQAREVFVVADGGVWIWKLKEQRFAHATGVLDFYHASQHLWACAHALFGEQGPEARLWVEPLLHQLRHGEEAGVLGTLTDLRFLAELLGEKTGETVEREINYFENHRDHIHYQDVSERGCPVGSGQMEATCAELQGRLKRIGQFWTEEGKENLLGLEVARRNGDWGEIWNFQPIQT